MSYSVRIGKKSARVYIRTPKGAVLRLKQEAKDREAAKQLARSVRRRLSGGGRLRKDCWDVVRRA